MKFGSYIPTTANGSVYYVHLRLNNNLILGNNILKECYVLKKCYTGEIPRWKLEGGSR
jgi:hypothetical protein